MDEYRGRFDPKKYEEDEPVAVGYGVPGTPEDWWKNIEDETQSRGSAHMMQQ